jgi:hypothetical protein
LVPEETFWAVGDAPADGDIHPHIVVGRAKLNAVEVSSSIGRIHAEVGFGTLVHAQVGLVVGEGTVTAVRPTKVKINSQV